MRKPVWPTCPRTDLAAPPMYHFARRWCTVVRRVVCAAMGALVAALLTAVPGSAHIMPWRIYAVRGGELVSLGPIASRVVSPAPTGPPPRLAPGWELTDWELADVTGDGRPEWVLLVWRPWRDWPIQRWVEVASPIEHFHDARRRSCHVILLDPQDGHELWAGSALPAPLLALAVGDVDGDGQAEVATLEGDYAAGRHGPASRIDIWQWVGFGFKLEYRSAPGAFRQLYLTDTGNGGILDLAVR
jgi:hypothetical protein